MDIIDIAWVAGIIEGEGCISLHKKAGWSVRVSMCDSDIIERLQAVTKLGTVHCYAPRGNQKKDVWTWQVVSRTDVYSLITDICLFMGERRLQNIFKISDQILNSSLAYCNYCSIRYLRNRGAQKFCTVECRLNDKHSTVKGTIGFCEYCSNQFERHKSDHRFCSGSCRDAWNWRKT